MVRSALPCTLTHTPTTKCVSGSLTNPRALWSLSTSSPLTLREAAHAPLIMWRYNGSIVLTLFTQNTDFTLHIFWNFTLCSLRWEMVPVLAPLWLVDIVALTCLPCWNPPRSPCSSDSKQIQVSPTMVSLLSLHPQSKVNYSFVPSNKDCIFKYIVDTM